jgi:hypothetical protein
MDTQLSPLVHHWRAFAYCLNLSRFSVLILAATLVLLLVAQGQDLLISVAEDGRYLVFLGGMSLWAFSIWLWARVLLDIRFPEPPADRQAYNFWRRHLPRVLGVLAFVAVAVASARTGQSGLFTWLALAGGLVFWSAVAWRRDLARAIARRMTAGRPEAHWLWVEAIGRDEPPPHPDLWSALRGVRGRIAAATLVAGLVLFFAGWLAPVALGGLLGALLLLMLWGATWLPIGSLITYLGNKSGLPLLTLLLAAAALFSLWNDNHEIPHAADGSDPAQRPTVTAAIADWKAANCRGDRCAPMVVVATAGGGIRAAYWTGTVLGRLHDTAPSLPEQLFAVSGVSGGSVGAAVYRAMLAGQAKAGCAGSMESCVQQVLARDFLGPVSAGLLYPDLLQRFLPWPLLPDRGRALESAWEQAFAVVTDGEGRFDLPLGGLNASAGRAWPALFLNATWVDNGRRIVASNLRFDQQSGVAGEPLALANDQLARLGRDLRLSSAAHNSARFPLVSPPGMWRDADGEIAGRLQDGGLFENFGAETALELLQAVCAEFTCSRDAVAFPSAQRPQLTPLVVLISSDPTLPDNLAASPQSQPISFAYELRATFRSFSNTRVGRGAEAATRLAHWAEANGRFASFRMCRPPVGSDEPPLGWALSASAQRTIEGYLGSQACPGNQAALLNVQTWLRR